ncbi:hypothetical protein MAMP_01133 [Methylophaga aminisulfidivorans MP]|uniref:Uncharacterized protein n=1 Tax=Methylophaga aminisulfidivorans MP TaxID=1026882 RepID=F5SZQ0_9GAMM|nr:hypothetical protein [Methylophaga aminisulfidivorans]EGL54477.1 hypothetical protein MAMP_01133 [Methylophaga aminisulfidivorans MP]
MSQKHEYEFTTKTPWLGLPRIINVYEKHLTIHRKFWFFPWAIETIPFSSITSIYHSPPTKNLHGYFRFKEYGETEDSEIIWYENDDGEFISEMLEFITQRIT